MSLTQLEQLYIDSIERWYNDFSQLVEDVFGIIKYSNYIQLPEDQKRIHRINKTYQQKWQEDAFTDFHLHPRLATKSGKGVGKTTWASWLILAFLTTRNEGKAACTAPSASQLFDCLWAEMAQWVRKIKPEYKPLLNFSVTASRAFIDGREQISFATARTARREQPEALQGLHAKNMLLLVDEASAVDDVIYEAGEGTMSTEGAKTVLIGNPTRPSGYFFECFNRDAKRWKTRTVSCRDSDLVTPEYIEGMRSKYGDESSEFRIGVLGEFPLGVAQGIISRHLVEAASRKTPSITATGELIWGLDVARGGNDRTALAMRRGRIMPQKVRWWQGKDLMQTCGIVADLYFSLPPAEKPNAIVIDVIGIGAGVYDRLRELGLPVIACNVSRKSATPGNRNLGVELWFRARDWFQPENNAEIMEDYEFVTEISSVEYDIDSGGNKFIPDKHAIGWSPDLADAFILTFMRDWRSIASDYRHSIVAPRNQLTYAMGSASYIGEQY